MLAIIRRQSPLGTYATIFEVVDDALDDAFEEVLEDVFDEFLEEFSLLEVEDSAEVVLSDEVEVSTIAAISELAAFELKSEDASFSPSLNAPNTAINTRLNPRTTEQANIQKAGVGVCFL